MSRAANSQSRCIRPSRCQSGNGSARGRPRLIELDSVFLPDAVRISFSCPRQHHVQNSHLLGQILPLFSFLQHLKASELIRNRPPSTTIFRPMVCSSIRHFGRWNKLCVNSPRIPPETPVPCSYARSYAYGVSRLSGWPVPSRCSCCSFLINSTNRVSPIPGREVRNPQTDRPTQLHQIRLPHKLAGRG